MEKKTKPGAIQQLLDYAGDNKKQLYFSTFLATLGNYSVWLHSLQYRY